MYHWYIHDGAWQSGCQVIFSRPDRWGDGLCQISTRYDDDPGDHIDGCGDDPGDHIDGVMMILVIILMG